MRDFETTALAFDQYVSGGVQYSPFQGGATPD